MLLPILFYNILSAKECGIVGCLQCDDSVTPNVCTKCDRDSLFADLENGTTSTECKCIEGFEHLYAEYCHPPTPIRQVTLETVNNVNPEVGVKCNVTKTDPEKARKWLIYEWYRVNDKGVKTKINTEDTSQKEYTIVSDDIGYKINVKATGVPTKGYEDSKESTLSQIVTASLTSITLSTENNLRARVGIKCQVTNIQPNYVDGKISYEWYRVDDQGVETIIDEQDINSKEYIMNEKDIGYKIKVKATGVEAKGCNGEASSILSESVLRSLTSVTLSTENNASPKVGVKCIITDIQPSDADGKVCYEWYRIDKQGTETVIDEQDSNEYKLTKNDVGYKIKVKVIGIETEGYAGDVSSVLSQEVLDLICPIGCQCDSYSEECKSCKANEHFVEKDGVIPKECECDTLNGYVLGVDNKKCVCDSTKHLVSGTDGNCVCDAGYKGDAINGCLLNNCPKFDQYCDQCDDDYNPQKCIHCKSNEFGISDSTHKCVLCKEVTKDANCKTCQLNEEKDKLICSSCNEGSTLVEGKCIPKQCPSGCICEKNGYICERCQVGYKEKVNNNVIVSCEPDFAACNPKEKVNGCLYCQNEEPFNKCIICNSDDDININPEPNADGVCTCKNGYILENDKCVPERSECTVSIPGCSKCYKDNTKSCAVCNEDKGYNSLPSESFDGNNICSCKINGFEPNDKDVCDYPQESNCNSVITGCLKCVTPDKCEICDITKLFQSKSVDGKCQCIEGYEINNQGFCSKPENKGCSINIIGCLKCNIDKCLYCDTESHFISDEKGKCICDNRFEMSNNGQCIEILEPAQIFTGQQIPLSPDFISHDSSNPNQLILNTKEMKANSPFGMLFANVENNIKSISIEENKYDNIYMILPEKGDLTVIKKEENAKCNLMLSKEKPSSTTLTLMKESKGINILNYIDGSALHLKSPEKGTIQLGNFSTQESIKISTENDVEFECINFFQKGMFEITDNNKNISAKHITVQRGAKGFLKGVEILEDLIVGPSSTTEFGDNVKIAGKSINIKYARTQALGSSFFTGIFKEIPKEIKISKIDSDLILEQESKSEVMTIAEGSKVDFKPEICNNWAKLVSGEFSDAICDESDSTNNKVIAKKIDSNNNKKKLNGGEIAGIAIACVVVVAAIIALFVYFLVIKKKNATNSTQEDSMAI